MQHMFIRTLAFVALLVSLIVPSTAMHAAEKSSGSTAIKVSVTASGAPVAQATVSIQPLNLTGTTDRTGTLVLDSLMPAERSKVNVTVRARGYRTWMLRNATLYPNDTLQIDAPLSQASASQSTPEVVDVQPHRLESGTAQEPGPANPQLAGEVGALATNTTPPSTIRVYRVSLGRIDTVDFRFYVKHVLPSEWIPSWHAESLRAGAMPVKTYGWYWTMYSKYPGSGYDVKDTTADQVYNPSVSYASTDAAVDATWNYRITRNSAIFQAHYCAGSYNSSRTSGQCSEKHGWTVGTYMSQWGSKWYADNGRGWQWMQTFYYDNVVVGTIGGTLPMPSWPVLRNGDSGVDVKGAQYLLRQRGYSIAADGIFGPATESAVRSFQSANGLVVDGVIGSQTFSKLIVTVRRGDTNEAVRAVQVLLGITNDGIFGSGTEAAVKNLQATYGLTQDGIVGPQTWQAAFGK
ncbi:MAG TPA: peptidoglycan-binding protein [Herpetosiphonaceae bacterium]